MNHKQIEASNPNYSVWLSASAGTGKTRVLINRILRLLISGVQFNRILCLTFTNAAAEEIFVRINKHFVDWSVSDTNKIYSDLTHIFGRVPKDCEVKIAKVLYKEELNSQEKININTIHSFCFNTLKRFPIESSINPGFQVLDEISREELIKKLIENFYLDTKNEFLVNFLIKNFHEVKVNDIFEEIIKQKNKLKNLLIKSSPFKIAKAIQKQSIYKKIQSEFLNIKAAFSSTKSLEVDYESLMDFFLTKNGEKRSNLVIKWFEKKDHELLSKLIKIQEQFYQLDQVRKMQEVMHCSNLFIELSKRVINDYEKLKRGQSFLDYDDLIFLTKKLFTKTDFRDWVLYKLDGGIDHLLIDEAQDTSFEQWEIIIALIGEFYSGEGAMNNTKRSIFIVGDEKQSIFSFQGASVDTFNMVKFTIKQKAVGCNNNFKILNLDISYRSAKEILIVVHDVFQKIKDSNPKLFTGANIKISPFRKDRSGIVELWPLIKNPSLKLNYYPNDKQNSPIFHTSPERQLAEKLVSFIKKQILDQLLIPSTGLPVKLEDFLILVRTRDNLFREIITQLRKNNLDVSNADKINLKENLSVLDLISAAKFTLNPYDDLNLASLLKSPIFALNDDQLRELIILKKDSSIWDYLKGDIFVENFERIIKINLAELYDKLEILNSIYKKTNSYNFFHMLSDSLDYRSLLIHTNGYDSNIAINELIYLSNNYFSKVNNSLQGFIYWFETHNVEVRSDSYPSSQIRLMTVHASKGLQSPIVILCDTTSVPNNKKNFFFSEDSKLFFSYNSLNTPRILKKIKEQEQNKDFQEYLRLLYVAMTRAEDYLIVCGYQKDNKIPDYCWYNLINHSMSDLTHDRDDIIKHYGSKFLYKGSNIDPLKQEQLLINATHLVKNTIDKDMLGCLNNNKVTLEYKKTLSNRKKSFLHIQENLEYGNVFHKILEDVMIQKNVLKLKFHPLIDTLASKFKKRIYKSIENLLQNEEFVNLSKQELKVELNIALNQKQLIKIGRIDLLAFYKEEIIIIEYKSDTPPPKKEKFIPLKYIEQINFYYKAIKKLYPNKIIKCKILWLADGKFMDVTNF